MNPKLTTENSQPKTQNLTRPVEASESNPPFLKSWRRLYTAVIAELAVLIVLFYLFTKAFE
jgi:hypothetical protein